MKVVFTVISAVGASCLFNVCLDYWHYFLVDITEDPRADFQAGLTLFMYVLRAFLNDTTDGKKIT